MSWTTSTALPSFSHDQHHETDAAQRKRGVGHRKRASPALSLRRHLKSTGKAKSSVGTDDYVRETTQHQQQQQEKPEGCIDDERQFKTAKRSQAPVDATVRKRFFCDNFVTFRHRSKRIAFLESVNFSTCVYMQTFNFRDGYGQWSVKVLFDRLGMVSY